MPDTNLDLVFLGSGNAFARGRYWSSFLLNGRYLFDAAPTALPHLKRLGLPVQDIDAIFVTHFHADHFFGLPFLLLEYAESTRRTRDLTIYGPPAIEERTRTITEAGFPGVFDKDAGYRVRYVEYRPREPVSLGDGASFVALPVEHTPTLESFGLRIEIAGRALAYSGDARPCPELLELAAGADVFIVDCSCWEGDCGPHMRPDDVAELRRRLPLTTRFVLTHLDAGERDLGLENTVVASDFAHFAL